jgi:hypothetical protein
MMGCGGGGEAAEAEGARIDEPRRARPAARDPASSRAPPAPDRGGPRRRIGSGLTSPGAADKRRG